MMKLSTREEALHRRALDLSRKYRRLEWLLIQSLQEVECEKLHKRLGFAS